MRETAIAAPARPVLRLRSSVLFPSSFPSSVSLHHDGQVVTDGLLPPSSLARRSGSSSLLTRRRAGTRGLTACPEPGSRWTAAGRAGLFLFTPPPGCAPAISVVVSEGRRLQAGYILHSPEQNTESKQILSPSGAAGEGSARVSPSLRSAATLGAGDACYRLLLEPKSTSTWLTDEGPVPVSLAETVPRSSEIKSSLYNQRASSPRHIRNLIQNN